LPAHVIWVGVKDKWGAYGHQRERGEALRNDRRHLLALDSSHGIKVAFGIAEFCTKGGSWFGSEQSPGRLFKVEGFHFSVRIRENGEQSRPTRGSRSISPIAETIFVAQSSISQGISHYIETLGVLFDTTIA